MSKTYTLAEVAKHNTENDCWIVVNNGVYDMTKFLTEHPGGKKVVVQVAGQDATKKFNLFHKPATLKKYESRLRIGTIGGDGAAAPAAPVKPTPSAAAATPAKVAPSTSSTQSTAVVPAAKPTTMPKQMSVFGEMVPYGDPGWYQGWHSPYYKEQHVKVRNAVREFVEREMMPHCTEWDEAKQLPRRLFKTLAEEGWLPGVAGSPWPVEYAGTKVGGGIKPEEFDPFCELILCDEICRCGSGGLVWGLFGGLSIGLPPVMKFASKPLRDRVAAPCFKGDKVICLAITEPYAGSDVSNIQCTAVKTPDGKHYIVNGEKKWITNGVFADFFTVAVRTGGKGAGGISLLVIDRSEGVTTRQMNCQGVWSSGTTYITFEDVKVPVENLIGKEGEGFKYIMYNFNHERWAIAAQSTRFARVCLEEAMRYSFKRKTFGKRLIEHPVIRLKLAHMARQVEATWSWIESITYQMSVMSFQEQSRTLGGPIALLKAQSTTVLEYCAREAAQIFGGLAYTRGGQGEKVERLYRETRAFAIPGGSEEIMLDLGVRQAIKPYAQRLLKEAQGGNAKL